MKVLMYKGYRQDLQHSVQSCQEKGASLTVLAPTAASDMDVSLLISADT